MWLGIGLMRVWLCGKWRVCTYFVYAGLVVCVGWRKVGDLLRDGKSVCVRWGRVGKVSDKGPGSFV